MNKSITLLALVILAFAGCKKESEKTEITTSEKDTLEVEKPETAIISECYEFVQAKDTISLSLDQNGAYVKGKLRFKNYEKDSSSGEIAGKYAGDTLKFDYTFQSEGTTSTMQMRFLKSGNSLLMGTGDMEDKNGKMVFRNPKGVKYEKSVVLVKTECE
ncbi:hypothetical protein [Flavobacterium sp.]|uniref:hypothetical protein n=1 Tax=Flavobacterium sp. TaxID=239 RepID=UPI0011F4E765|nr:hypothetical protein [Flavobacterium sp.]RZJ70377.1 MAG: hypothetical protein EOO49_13930 [Flavobacterium sp.]